MKLTAVPGLQVAMSVGGQHLKEYDVEEEEAGLEANVAAARYVEAVSGANFAVQVRIDQSFASWRNGLAIRVFLDGVYAESVISEPHLSVDRHPPIAIGARLFCENGQYFFRKFAFADLITNDGPTEADLKAKLANIGEVTVKVYRVTREGEAASAGLSFLEAVGSDGIPEKALKGRAISNRATLSRPVPAPPRKFVSVRYPWGRDPIATFTFKYRSRKDLQIEGIIPRSPSPVPLEERDPETLSAEEARELVRMQRQQRQDQVRIKKEKRERDGDDTDEDGEVTVVYSQRKRPRTSPDSGIEVIDLSYKNDEDDD